MFHVGVDRSEDVASMHSSDPIKLDSTGHSVHRQCFGRAKTLATGLERIPSLPKLSISLNYFPQLLKM